MNKYALMALCLYAGGALAQAEAPSASVKNPFQREVKAVPAVDARGKAVVPDLDPTEQVEQTHKQYDTAAPKNFASNFQVKGLGGEYAVVRITNGINTGMAPMVGQGMGETRTLLAKSGEQLLIDGKPYTLRIVGSKLNEKRVHLYFGKALVFETDVRAYSPAAVTTPTQGNPQNPTMLSNIVKASEGVAVPTNK